MHTKCTQLHRISQNGELLAWSGSDFFLTKPAAAIITRANNTVSSDGNTSTTTYALCTFCRFLVQIWNDAKASESFLQISKKTQALPLHYLYSNGISFINPLNPELNPICYFLALLGAHHFFHVSRIRVKLLTFRLLMSFIYIYGAPILDVSRSHTTTQHSR